MPTLSKHRIDGAQVDALFRGEVIADHTVKDLSESGGVRTNAYSRCARCRIAQPLLFSFQGKKDWSDVIPLDGPVRDAVKLLRKEFNAVTILLCGGCIDELGGEENATEKNHHETEAVQSLF